MREYRQVNLDFTNPVSREQIHQEIAEKLAFPDYYGRNLDALYDCLTDLREDIAAEIAVPSARIPLSDWLSRVCGVFRDAAADNPHLKIRCMRRPGIAVLFPGIGYTCDRSLLYFAGRLAAEAGYEVRSVPYRNFPQNIRGDREKMEACFHTALEQAEEMLKEVDWESCGDILFIGKSIGTIVSGAYAKAHCLKVRSVLFTPLADTFRFAEGGTGAPAVAFHGTKDPWAETDAIAQACALRGIRLHVTEHANHSLETGDVQTDLETLRSVMRVTERFIRAEQSEHQSE